MSRTIHGPLFARAMGAFTFGQTTIKALFHPATPCRFCRRSDRLEVDLGFLSGYGRRDKSDAWAKHQFHIAEAIVAEPAYRNGTHGRKILDAFEEALKTARSIIKEARQAGELALALEGVKVIASIGESQAKIAGMMPVKNRTAQHLHLYGDTPRQALTRKDAQRVLEDLIATSDEEAEEKNGSDAPFLETN